MSEVLVEGYPAVENTDLLNEDQRERVRRVLQTTPEEIPVTICASQTRLDFNDDSAKSILALFVYSRAASNGRTRVDVYPLEP